MNQRNGDSGREIWFLNRNLVVVRPRQPFIDWVREVDPGDPVGADFVREQVSAFLIDQFEVPGEAEKWVEDQCDFFFRFMCNEWYTDPALWPTFEGWKKFGEWFDVEYIEMAWDLIDAPLSSDPPPRS